MELLTQEFIREMATNHQARIIVAKKNNTIPQIMNEIQDEIDDLTEDLKGDDLKRFDELYFKELCELSAIAELETFDNDIKATESEANNAKLEFEKSKQDQKDAKVFGYVILFLLIVLLCALIFSQ